MKYTPAEFRAMPIGTILSTGHPRDPFFASMKRTADGWDNLWGIGWPGNPDVPGSEIDWQCRIDPINSQETSTCPK